MSKHRHMGAFALVVRPKKQSDKALKSFARIQFESGAIQVLKVEQSREVMFIECLVLRSRLFGC